MDRWISSEWNACLNLLISQKPRSETRLRPGRQDFSLTLQLSIRGLDRLLAIHLLLIDLLLTAIIPKRCESLRQDRVREVVARVHPVGVHGAEVLDLQLDEGAG